MRAKKKESKKNERKEPTDNLYPPDFNSSWHTAGFQFASENIQIFISKGP